MQTQAERIRNERIEIEDENTLRQQKRFEQNEIDRDRLKKQAEDEAQHLLLRLKVIEDEESERMKKKRLAEYEFQIQNDKISKLMGQEISTRMPKTKYKFTTNYRYLNSSPNFEFEEPKGKLTTMETHKLKSRLPHKIQTEDPLNDSA